MAVRVISPSPPVLRLVDLLRLRGLYGLKEIVHSQLKISAALLMIKSPVSAALIKGKL